MAKKRKLIEKKLQVLDTIDHADLGPKTQSAEMLDNVRPRDHLNATSYPCHPSISYALDDPEDDVLQQTPSTSPEFNQELKVS